MKYNPFGPAGRTVEGGRRIREILEEISGGLISGYGVHRSRLRTFGLRGAGSLGAIGAAAGSADFTDPDGDTRFLGDLYQDLSEAAKKTYALLQTPRFIASFRSACSA